MRFHLGRPILVMLVISVVGGAWVLLRPAPPRADLTFWTFADSHAESYRQLAPRFTGRTGRSVDVQLIPAAALNTRLSGLFMAGSSDGQMPDAVELQMSTAGPYFRPPAGEVGLLPLNPYLETTGLREIDDPSAAGKPGWHARSRSDGKIYTFGDGRWNPDPSRTRPDAWIDRVVAARFAPWSKRGLIFGVPHDVHPVTITYRHDLFWEDPDTHVGPHIDLASAGTWPEFQALCLRFQDYWRARGEADRSAIELFEWVPEHLACLLLQRGVNLIDADEQLHLTDPKVAETLVFYTRLVAGPQRISTESTGGADIWPATSPPAGSPPPSRPTGGCRTSAAARTRLPSPAGSA